MAVLLVNVSGGNIHLHELKTMLAHGGRLELPMTANEVKAISPELSMLERRGRILISEDAELVEEDKSIKVPEPPLSDAELKHVKQVLSDLDAGEYASSNPSDSKVE
jgi:hypothetical protein